MSFTLEDDPHCKQLSGQDSFSPLCLTRARVFLAHIVGCENKTAQTLSAQEVACVLVPYFFSHIRLFTTEGDPPSNRPNVLAHVAFYKTQSCRKETPCGKSPSFTCILSFRWHCPLQFWKESHLGESRIILRREVRNVDHPATLSRGARNFVSSVTYWRI